VARTGTGWSPLRLLFVYDEDKTSADSRIWIITEASRSATTILRPEDSWEDLVEVEGTKHVRLTLHLETRADVSKYFIGRWSWCSRGRESHSSTAAPTLGNFSLSSHEDEVRGWWWAIPEHATTKRMHRELPQRS
jgi:hypothetical protein